MNRWLAALDGISTHVSNPESLISLSSDGCLAQETGPRSSSNPSLCKVPVLPPATADSSKIKKGIPFFFSRKAIVSPEIPAPTITTRLPLSISSYIALPPCYNNRQRFLPMDQRH